MKLEPCPLLLIFFTHTHTSINTLILVRLSLSLSHSIVFTLPLTHPFTFSSSSGHWYKLDDRQTTTTFSNSPPFSYFSPTIISPYVSIPTEIQFHSFSLSFSSWNKNSSLNKLDLNSWFFPESSRIFHSFLLSSSLIPFSLPPSFSLSCSFLRLSFDSFVGKNRLVLSSKIFSLKKHSLALFIPINWTFNLLFLEI